MTVPPFNIYYPAFDGMDRSQKRFYKHFRTSVMRGNFVDVDGQISYIFCYAYELIAQTDLKKSFSSLTGLADLYANETKVKDYLNGWAADCAILLEDFDAVLRILPIPRLGTTWGLIADKHLSVKLVQQVPPSSRELVAVIGPKVTKYGREHLEDVERYLDVHLDELSSKDDNLIASWIQEFQIHKTPFHPFNGVPGSLREHQGFTSYHFSNSEKFRSYVAGLIRQAENVLRIEKGLPRVGEGWVSETHLFYQLKEALAEYHVQQYARPSWLGRQHLDIYIPDLSIAVEFQGEQHDRLIEFFGGQEAFEQNQKRDKKKRNACKKNGVTLIEVRKGYDIEALINEIRSMGA